MATIINADNGSVSGSAGLKQSSDASGVLELQTNGTTAVTVSTGQNVSFANAVNTPNTFGFKNRIINGDMRIDQRNVGAAVTPTGGTYLLDRYFYQLSQASKATIQQNAGSVTPPTGFTNYLGVTSTSAYSSGASDFFRIFQPIEGLNVSDLAWGTANAKTVTLSFWVRSSLTGTFGGSLQNSASNRSYPFTYTISSANTWEYETITIAGDTSGTWLTTNGTGIVVGFNLGTGTTFSGTAGAWAGANLLSATGATSVLATNGATFYITGVQFETGNQATGFDVRPYTTELQLCQRYYTKLELTKTLVYATTTTYAQGNYRLPVTMRAAPTSTATNATNMNELYVTNITGTYVPSSSCDTDSVWVIATNTGGTAFTANRQYRFNTPGCSIDFSSEL